MKKILTLAIVAILCIGAVTGCKKSDSGSSYSMKATVGTTAFNVSNSYATINGNILSISGNSGSSTSTYAAPYLTVVLYDYTNTGTYTIDTTATSPNVAATYAPDLTISDFKLSHTGSVTISSVTSTQVVGTFNFVLTDGSTITGGTFTAKRIN